jgi:hypothetical protein
VIPLPQCTIIRIDDRTPGAVARDVQRREGTAYTRIGRGVYVERARWDALDERDRHLVQVWAAIPRLLPGAVFANESALLLHGVRLLGRVPPRVVIGSPERTRVDRRSPWTEHHPLPPGTRTDAQLGPYAVPVLDLAAAAAAVARSMSFRAAVVVLDQVLRRGVARAEIAALLARGPRRGTAAAEAALEFADARSDSVGESLARIVLHEAGAPVPVLQHRFRSPEGLHALVDFWFPDQGVVVEYDGAVKYRDSGTRGGRTAEQVVIDEKHREDWIRALSDVRGFVRLTARDLRSRAFVAATLRSAGVPARW